MKISISKKLTFHQLLASDLKSALISTVTGKRLGFLCLFQGHSVLLNTPTELEGIAGIL